MNYTAAERFLFVASKGIGYVGFFQSFLSSTFFRYNGERFIAESTYSCP